jgi:hypothetical protein
MKQIVKKEDQYFQLAKTVIDSWHSCMNVLVEDDAWNWVDEVSNQVTIQINILKRIKQLAIEQDFGNKLPIQ